ncbi:glycosyltransferase family 2 protein [Candidatus Curtissbacteria bacterium]|nr:glycosyltransferase family 2 protein [Candidatus Curtissbacteria bacterium]
MNKLNISALVLAKNEEAVIEGCLKQLGFVSEIIVLDQESTDKTVKIAKKYADKVLKTQDGSFAKNRNTLAEVAKYDWLLYLDTDERIDENNVEEIESSIKNEQYSAYYFPRKNIVLGKWLKHGGWWPDYVPRLFKKKDLIKWVGTVHESPQVKGNIKYLESPITHLTARSMDLMFQKTIKWAKVEAELFHRANFPKVTQFTICKSMMREFIARYFAKLAILDGKVGLIESVYQSLHQAIVQVYLWEIQNEVEEKFKQESKAK